MSKWTFYFSPGWLGVIGTEHRITFIEADWADIFCYGNIHGRELGSVSQGMRCLGLCEDNLCKEQLYPLVLHQLDDNNPFSLGRMLSQNRQGL